MSRTHSFRRLGRKVQQGFTLVELAIVLAVIGLIIGAVGFALVPFVHDKNLLAMPFMLIGCAWAAMLAMPFAFAAGAAFYLYLINDFGLLPIAAVLAVWGAMQTVYALECIRLSKRTGDA